MFLFHWCVKYCSSTDQKLCLPSLYLSHPLTSVAGGIYSSCCLVEGQKQARTTEKQNKARAQCCSEAFCKVRGAFEELLNMTVCIAVCCFLMMELCIQEVWLFETHLIHYLQYFTFIQGRKKNIYLTPLLFSIYKLRNE